MNDSEFDVLVDGTLMRIEEQIEDADGDIDFEMMSGILTLIMPNQSKVIVNRQLATHEIWVAAKSGGYHCGYADGHWLCNTTKETLQALLMRVIAEQGGGDITL